jgi:hypothetical protein
MAELLDRIHAEIRERLAATRGAMEEYERLQAALTALGDPPSAERPRRRASREAAPAPVAEPEAAPAAPVPVAEREAPPVAAAPVAVPAPAPEPTADEPGAEPPALAA